MLPTIDHLHLWGSQGCVRSVKARTQGPQLCPSTMYHTGQQHNGTSSHSHQSPHPRSTYPTPAHLHRSPPCVQLHLRSPLATFEETYLFSTSPSNPVICVAAAHVEHNVSIQFKLKGSDKALKFWPVQEGAEHGAQCFSVEMGGSCASAHIMLPSRDLMARMPGKQNATSFEAVSVEELAVRVHECVGMKSQNTG